MCDSFQEALRFSLLLSINHPDFLAAFKAVVNSEHLRESVLELRERPRLTQREIEVLRFVAQGKTDKEIAHALQISVNTVRNHVQNILRKLGVSNRDAAVWRARHWEWI